ncbi:p21-C-terminal region-binding protein-domain-containing protein [Phascolomyces articulosus]|uniref:Protein BCP1 n=1 Tax=Phascolomyces articulosus TaxID=60185 RepID=A0AAD5K9A2_9FUNG|nr:p21-C-terminal region-binding protein-domain-containing protein [Phascolomyces articulosus]
MKRKASEENINDVSDNESSDNDGPQDIVDVDFDFYNPDQTDYQSLKRLLGQLFSSDAELIQLGDIVEILLEENHVGTTVKVDGQESDPYAILSVISMEQNKDNAGIKSLQSYLLGKAKDETIKSILNGANDKKLGWVISERFINMPMEIMPPMYKMMQEETNQAVEKGEPYTFEWYMFISKTYKEVAPTVDEDGDENMGEVQKPQPKKKGKKKKAQEQQQPDTETFYFQPEDEVIAQFADYKVDFKFTNREKESSSDAKRAFSDFGIAPARRLMFVHQSKFAEAISEIERICVASS